MISHVMNPRIAAPRILFALPALAALALPALAKTKSPRSR